MRVRRMATVVLALALVIGCCACSQEPETPAEVAEKMRSALA